MQTISRITLYILTLLLVACVSHKVVVNKAIDAKNCDSMCQEALRACMPVCHDNCHECSKAESRITARHYHRYLEQVSVQGQVVTRELQSYRDPLQCRKITCHCIADYNICKQACTGIIYKRLQAASACC